MNIDDQKDSSVKEFIPEAISNEIPGTFHGGFVRHDDKGIRVDQAKTCRLPKPNRADVVQRLEASEQRKNAGRDALSFPKGSSPARARKTKLSVMGLSSDILDAGDPRYAACVRLANAYRKVRTREMCIAYEFVSSGVSSMLASASMALAGARFLYEAAAEVPIQPAEKGDVGKAQLLKLASSLADSSRQNELAAWELCAREAVIRKRNEANNVAIPWLLETSAGAEKRKPGRPRKTDLQLENHARTIHNPESPSSPQTESVSGPGQTSSGPWDTSSSSYSQY